MHPSLCQTEHRPWPLPNRPWSGRQSWCDLLFAHYPVAVESVRHLVPSELEIDQWDGQTYVGVVPFRMEGVMARFLPDLPGVSAFPELNVRLYVRYGDRPGVWFLSLDADSALAVWGARRFFHLPYYRADMLVGVSDADVVYRSHRKKPEPRPVFRARYRPTSEAYFARSGTLEHFLTERYCLYAKSPSGGLFRTEVHHGPWPLQRAELALEQSTLLEPHGLRVASSPVLLHFARRIDVIVWNPERLG